MAAAPIDLSAGLVPKAGPSIDLSAGLVPKAQSDTRSLFQKAKDNFNANTQGAQPGDGAVKGFIENIGQGGGQALSALAHPLDTLSSMGHMVAHPLDQAHAEVNALHTDPSRFLGNAIGQVGTGAIIGEGSGAAADAASSAAGRVVGRAALLGKTPEEAYESALKIPPSIPTAERASAVQGGLQNSIPVSKAGLENISDRLDELDHRLSQDVIGKDPTRAISGTPNNLQNLYARRNQFASQATPVSDLNAFDAAKNEFLEQRGVRPAIAPQPTGILDAQGNPIMTAGKPATQPQPMEAAQAQAIKRGTYQVLKGKFGEQGSAAVEAQKALASDINAEITRQFPEAAGINAQMGKLLDLQPFVERAVNRMSNQGMFRLGTGAVAGTIKAIGGSNKLAATAAVLKQVLDDPVIKSRLAIAVSKGAKIPYAQAVTRVGSYSATLGSTAAASQENSSADNPNQSIDGQP
jgi:hypothetical protein